MLVKGIQLFTTLQTVLVQAIKKINNVKAGVADTDAVNVSQLKRLQDQIAASSSVTTVTAGDHIKVTPTVMVILTTTRYLLQTILQTKLQITQQISLKIQMISKISKVTYPRWINASINL